MLLHYIYFHLTIFQREIFYSLFIALFIQTFMSYFTNVCPIRNEHSYKAIGLFTQVLMITFYFFQQFTNFLAKML